MNEIQSFISSLTQINDQHPQQPYYIKKVNNYFEITSSKLLKNLNTEMIAELAERYFEVLEKNKILTPDHRVKIFASLGRALKLYNERIKSAKPWLLRILSWLGIKSSLERRIDSLSKRAFQESKESKKIFIGKFPSRREAISNSKRTQKFDAIVTEILSKELNYLEKDLVKLSSFNLKILDSINLEIFDENIITKPIALDPLQGILIVLQDLVAFKQHVTHEKSKAATQKAIDQLQFNLRISALLNHTDTTFFNHWLENKIPYRNQQGNFVLIEEIAHEILTKMKQLLPSFKEACHSSFIFSGGYSKSTKKSEISGFGHNVLFKISRQPNGLYTFTMINTGEEANLAEEEKSKEPLNPDPCKLGLTEEENFTDLTEEELSKSFFFDLLNFKIVGTESMKNVNAFIKSRLYHPSAPKRKGRHFFIQNKGSCAIKPILKWLNGEFDSPLYQQFSVFVAKRGLESIEKIVSPFSIVGKRKGINPLSNQFECVEYRGEQLIQFMLTEGSKIHAHKIDKLKKNLSKEEESQ